MYVSGRLQDHVQVDKILQSEDSRLSDNINSNKVVKPG
jgi:hypothetical protein